MEHIGVQLNNPAASLAGAAAARTETQQAEQKIQRVPETRVTEDKLMDPRNNEESRFEAVKKAAQARTSSFYPINATRFTIYKESASGAQGFVYTTRFTDLQTGEVSYVKEPELLANYGKVQGTLLDGVV